MMRRPLLALAATGCLAGSVALTPPTVTAWREFAAWFVRPVALPLAWRALQEAQGRSDTTETFLRAQQILQLLPTWTDGYAAFAYRYVLDGGDATAPAADRALALRQRLRIALAWLEAGRAYAGRREFELLQTMAFVPLVAVRQEPGLAALLPDGGAEALTDAYLAEAAAIHPTAAVREQYIFMQPRRVASLLAMGDRRTALLVLDAAIARSVEVRDQQLATEWRARLDEVRRHLRGEANVDLTAVRADPRLQDLLPHLR